MIKTKEIVVKTHKEFELVSIMDEVVNFVKSSGIKEGMVFIVTAHTSSGIMVNENLECLKTDIEETLETLAPLDHQYAHSHVLLSYGATGGNAPGHLKQMLTGNHTMMVIKNGSLDCGFAQSIFFSEFDGPQNRKVVIQIQGE